MTFALYCMFLRPIPSVLTFRPIPLPSSLISRTGRPARIASPIVMLVAPACFTAFATEATQISHRLVLWQQVLPGLQANRLMQALLGAALSRDCGSFRWSRLLEGVFFPLFRPISGLTRLLPSLQI